MKKNKKIKISEFFRNYLSILNNSLNSINLENLEKASKLILNTIKKKKNYICVREWWVCSNFKSLCM